MQIEFERKTKDSWSGNCPARYKVKSSEGGWVIQGKQVHGETRAQLRDLGTDQDAVWIPEDLSGNRPALCRVKSLEGGWVIQGKRIDIETRAQLRDLGADEDAVWILEDLE